MNVSKKFLALLMAMLMAFSCMAVSASAAGTEGGTSTETIIAPVTAPTLVSDDAKLTITVSNYTKKQQALVNGKSYDIKVEISPADGVITSYDINDNYLFSNLQFGKTYTVTAKIVDDSTDGLLVTGSASSTAKFLYKQDAPAAPVPVEVTSKSIKISTVVGQLYKITAEDGSSIGYDWAKANSGAILYENLNADTKYVISVKKAATSTHYESAETKITVKTKLVGKTGVPSIYLVDKNDSSITVNELTNVEYSLNGTTWQKSNIFSGLKSNTEYTVYARYTFDVNKEDPSKVTEALVIKTNARANYVAKEKNITFSADKDQYANSEIKFTVKGDGPSNMAEAIYGDTRLVPVSYKVVFGNTDIKGSTAFEGNKLVQNGSFTAPDYAEKVVTVKVTYAHEEFKGTDWQLIELVEKKNDIKLGKVNNAGTQALGFFEAIGNFLFNAVPAFLAQALRSDVWARLLEVIGNIGKVIG